MFTGSSRGNPHVPGDETTRLAGREAGVAIRMRGQPHVRGSSTDGRNPNLIPREHKDKATSAVEWGLRRPRGKGRRRWNRKKSEQEERAHSKQRQRSAEENSFRISDQTKVSSSSSSSDVDVHPGFSFFWFYILYQQQFFHAIRRETGGGVGRVNAPFR